MAYYSHRTIQMLVLLLVLALGCFAQQPQPTAPPKAPIQPTQPVPQAEAKAPVDRQMTAAEGKKLLDAVDEVLKFDSGDSALPIKHEVKRQLADRAQVQAYIEKELREDEDAQRLKSGEIVLKKLGLLPRNFNLDEFLVRLMREQVAGYYDPDTKFVNMLNWLPPETQLPVLAHELTHALQDQSFDLKKFTKGKSPKDKKAVENIVEDEALAARHAIIEGQAMAVMIDYILAPTGQSLMSAPQIADAMEAGMGAGSDSPTYNSAPLYLKRMLIFPYTYGLNFERQLMTNKGKQEAFSGVFQRPPRSTREVMQPAAYLANEALPPLNPPDVAAVLGKDWEMYDIGSMGEFDVAAWVEQFSDVATAKKIHPNWRGGYYYAVKKKGTDPKTPGDIVLVFVTKWASPDAAKEFAELYGSAVSKRLTSTGALGAGFGITYSTSDGPVFVARSGKLDNVIVIESLDQANTKKVYDAVAKTLQ